MNADVDVTAIELCAGVGQLGEGLRAGLQHLGFSPRVLCYVEREAYPVGVLAARGGAHGEGGVVSTAKPCQHRRRIVGRFFASIYSQAEDGRPALWSVVEVLACVKCKEELGGRWVSGKLHKTERAALKAYGVPEADLPAPPNHKAKAAVSVPCTGWPFPASDHDWGAEGSPIPAKDPA